MKCCVASAAARAVGWSPCCWCCALGFAEVEVEAGVGFVVVSDVPPPDAMLAVVVVPLPAGRGCSSVAGMPTLSRDVAEG